MREPKGILIMYVTATQSKVEYAQYEATTLRDTRHTVPEPESTLVTAVFTKQHGVGRLDELAKTLDFPLDFQI